MDVRGDSIPNDTAAVVLVSAGLQENVEALGFMTMLNLLDVHIVTVLSGEDFKALDQSCFHRFDSASGSAQATAAEWELLWTYAPGATLQDIKTALEQVYRILALRFA